MKFYNKHYITVDERGRIINGFSDGFYQPSEADICINEKGGYQFRLFSGGEENPPLYELPCRIPLYKYEDGEIVKRTEDEIGADIATLPVPEETPSQIDQIEAQVVYTAMMTDTLLEV